MKEAIEKQTETRARITEKAMIEAAVLPITTSL